MAVDTTTFDSAAEAAELARALMKHTETFGARVGPPASTPLLKIGQDGSVIDRRGRVLLAKPVPPK